MFFFVPKSTQHKEPKQFMKTWNMTYFCLKSRQFLLFAPCIFVNLPLYTWLVFLFRIFTSIVFRHWLQFDAASSSGLRCITMVLTTRTAGDAGQILTHPRKGQNIITSRFADGCIRLPRDPKGDWKGLKNWTPTQNYSITQHAYIVGQKGTVGMISVWRIKYNISHITLSTRKGHQLYIIWFLCSIITAFETIFLDFKSCLHERGDFMSKKIIPLGRNCEAFLLRVHLIFFYFRTIRISLSTPKAFFLFSWLMGGVQLFG